VLRYRDFLLPACRRNSEADRAFTAPTQHTINGKTIPSVTARRLRVITLKSARHQARLGQFDFKAVAVVLSCSFFKACCSGLPRAIR
jgi:hypothetical protein